MNPVDYGFMLLTSRLGDPQRRPLTSVQMRKLSSCLRELPGGIPEKEMEPGDLVSIGIEREFAERIVNLLDDTDRLRAYLEAGERLDCTCLTRTNPAYPLIIRRRLGLDSPGCLWLRGDMSLLNGSAVALVGNRDLMEQNCEFASEVGRQAAEQGVVLVSGNAKGADNAAQEACLKAGGRVISVVADAITEHEPAENVLYLSEESFDEPFSPQRALSRNRVIHALGTLAFVAQCSEEKGGTWDGTVKNLRSNWSPVLCFRDGSPVSVKLEALGARLIETDELQDFSKLAREELNLFER